MTPTELKLVTQLFTILPTITIAISLAVIYVKYQNVIKSRNDRLDGIESLIEQNHQDIIKIVKIHLDHHPDDANEFIKDEFNN